jgi:ankyrin repeat protein
VKELVRAGADLNLQNEEGLSALAISSRSGRTDSTKILLSGENIVIDIQTSNGWSPIFFAAERRDVATTHLLLKAGAKPHLRDHSGLTALDVAAASDHVGVCQLLGKHMEEAQARHQTYEQRRRQQKRFQPSQCNSNAKTSFPGHQVSLARTHQPLQCRTQ